MQSNMMSKLVDHGFNLLVKKDIKDKEIRKKISKEYNAIVERAKDIGSSNRLLSSYLLAAYFIAMNRENTLTPQENYEILDRVIRRSHIVRLFLGNGKSYMSEKNMVSRRQWSKETHQHKYENDWVVDVVEQADDFRFGFDYHECGVCKLCKDEGCFELAKYLCKLDFMLVEIIGIKLKRTTTLADGGDKCDFRFYEK